MTKLYKYFAFLLITFLISFSHFSYAKSGCCSWHGGVSGCDTSTGRQVCNDGTYSPSCTCQYIAPRAVPKAPVCDLPSLGGNGSYDIVEDNCLQNVHFTWTKGTNDDFYSISISKTKGADPGPNSDTSSNEFLFKNVQPGTWFVNLKPGRSCGWGEILSWTVVVPDKSPNISLIETTDSANNKTLSYTVECATSAEITPEVGTVKLGSGTAEINPKEDTTYVLLAKNGNQTSTKSVDVKITKQQPDITATPQPTVTPMPTVTPIKAKPDTSTSDTVINTSFLLGLGGLGYYLSKRK